MSGDDDMNGNIQPPLPGNPALPLPAGNPPPPQGNHPQLPAGNPNAAQPGPPLPAPFVLPTARQIADEIPEAASRDPHLRVLPTQPFPPIDAELERSSFQHSAGQFGAHIITNKRLYRGISATQLADFEESPHHKIGLTIANGGDHVLSRVTYEVPLGIQIERVLRTLAPVGYLKVRLPLPDPDAPGGGGKYGGPTTVLVEVEDDAGAAAISAQVVFGVHDLLGFWAHDLETNRTTTVWSFGHWDMVRPETDKADIEAYARAGFVLVAYKTTEIFRLIDRLTQALGGDPKRRVFNALNTAHFVLLQHDEKPVVVGYMEPLTTNDAEQEQLNRLLRDLSFGAGNYAFTNRSKNGYAPECAYCKAADHPAFHCPYTQPELGFWGPIAQLSDLPPDHPWYIANGGGQEVDHGGRGRGGGGGFGRGGRDRGGRGGPYGGGYGGRGSGYGNGGARGNGRIYRGGWRGRGY
ncbi:hypothetical protein DFH09DRAFT_1217244 [Mycena vulgaris]|nr:hypothetical protein DFH09DRAFT_1217244 [Mycena vulgaris]